MNFFGLGISKSQRVWRQRLTSLRPRKPHSDYTANSLRAVHFPTFGIEEEENEDKNGGVQCLQREWKFCSVDHGGDVRQSVERDVGTVKLNLQNGQLGCSCPGGVITDGTAGTQMRPCVSRLIWTDRDDRTSRRSNVVQDTNHGQKNISL